MNENSKLLSLLGLAKKAGRISTGHDAVLESLKKKKAKLIILASDSSERLEREMRREVDFAAAQVETIRIAETMADIGRALPKKAGVISVNDESFAAGILKVIKEG